MIKVLLYPSFGPFLEDFKEYYRFFPWVFPVPLQLDDMLKVEDFFWYEDEFPDKLMEAIGDVGFVRVTSVYWSVKNGEVVQVAILEDIE